MVGTTHRTIIETLLCLLLVVSPQSLPKPQIATAEGKPAPNFTLKDEHGKTFRLGSMRGKCVLLIFYRGYW
jgi:hypothetical protein